MPLGDVLKDVTAELQEHRIQDSEQESGLVTIVP
jgi:hypothetical protein